MSSFSSKKKFGEALLDSSLIDEEELNYALRVQESLSENKKVFLGSLIASLGFASENDILPFLSKQMELPYTFLTESRSIDSAYFDKFPEQESRKYQIFPFYQEKEHIFVYMSNPSDEEAISVLQKYYHCYQVHRFVVPKNQLRRFIERSYRNVEGVHLLEKLVSQAKDGSAEELLHYFLTDSIKYDATDLHISPSVNGLVISYRIDGILKTKYVISEKVAGFLMNVIVVNGKGQSGVREGQDLVFEYKIGDHSMTCRVSLVPVKIGSGAEDSQKIVIRIQDPARLNFQLDSLGISKPVLHSYKKILSEENGLVLLVGPIGSGKTSTLYSTIQACQPLRRHVFTIEDPVEFDLPSITQVEVDGKILTFEKVMEKSLRQDVDVILLGEMRNLEVMNLSIELALQGKLVFSTLHATDAPTAILRFLEKGIAPNFLCATLKAVMAQRLIRTICSSCKYKVSPEYKHKAFYDAYCEKFGLQKFEFYEGRGCAECGQTGYRGRVPLVELMKVSPEIKNLMESNMELETIRECAIEGGMVPLEEDAWLKVREGVVSLDELIRKDYFRS